MDLDHLSLPTTPMYVAFVYLAAHRDLLPPHVSQYIPSLCRIIVFVLMIPVSIPLASITKALLPSFPITAPYGTLRVLDASEPEAATQVLHEIESHTNDGDYMFVTSLSAPPLYALTNRRSPTYYDSLIDLIKRPSREKEERICASLMAHPAKLLIHREDRALGKRPSRRYPECCPVLQDCLTARFTSGRTFGPYVVSYGRDG